MLMRILTDLKTLIYLEKNFRSKNTSLIAASKTSMSEVQYVLEKHRRPEGCCFVFRTGVWIVEGPEFKSRAKCLFFSFKYVPYDFMIFIYLIRRKKLTYVSSMSYPYGEISHYVRFLVLYSVILSHII